MSWWSSAQSSPTKIIRSPPDYVVVQPIQSRRPPGGNLMDQCSAARHPISATGNLANRPGHDLHLGIDQHPRFSLCSPAGGSVISLPRSERNPCQEHADRFPLGSQTRCPKQGPCTGCIAKILIPRPLIFLTVVSKFRGVLRIFCGPIVPHRSTDCRSHIPCCGLLLGR